jgi:hypothetical protein
MLTHAEQRDLPEILEDRHQRASTIVTGQVPVEQWHEIHRQSVSRHESMSRSWYK